MKLPESMSNMCQICLLVKDIRASMDFYASIGIGPFKVYAMDTRDMEGVTYRGKPADYSLEVAWTQVGPWTLELLQPMRGDNIYKDWMKKHGEGLHHFGIYLKPEDYADGCKFLESQGCPQIMGGPINAKDRDGNFDYFDTQEKYGTIFELLDMPDDLGEPSYVYPEE